MFKWKTILNAIFIKLTTKIIYKIDETNQLIQTIYVMNASKNYFLYFLSISMSAHGFNLFLILTFCEMKNFFFALFLIDVILYPFQCLRIHNNEIKMVTMKLPFKKKKSNRGCASVIKKTNTLMKSKLKRKIIKSECFSLEIFK